jgi:hypothetical protein
VLRVDVKEARSSGPDRLERPANDARYRALSHSIINEPFKLLICRVLAAAPQTFTVIFAVKVWSASIGAGLRADVRQLIFRDRSRSIDSWGARRTLHRAST